MAYIIGGLTLILLGACAIAPIILNSMSKEERDAAGIVWKDSDGEVNNDGYKKS